MPYILPDDMSETMREQFVRVGITRSTAGFFPRRHGLISAHGLRRQRPLFEGDGFDDSPVDLVLVPFFTSLLRGMMMTIMMMNE